MLSNHGLSDLPMNTLEINSILRQNPKTKKIYRGCFPSNKLPRCRFWPCAMVANFDEHNKPGSHWVVIFAPNKYRAYFFDSLGTDGVLPIKRYLNRNFAYVTHMRKKFQKPRSSVCGQYAIFFVYILASGFPPRKIPHLLSSVRNPDRFVVDYVNRYVLV